MSNALAIAAVTESLVELVSQNIGASQVAGAQVTAVAPDEPGLPKTGVNIYLYQISPNAAFRNADGPTRTADGALLRRPQAALDLHYLFTFYGDDATRERERLLGAVAVALHAQPVLPRSLIQSVEVGFLAAADLDRQSELVRLTPIVFTLEELSKLWSFLLKVDYVLSTAYRASVVLIETQDPVPPPALPALGMNLDIGRVRAPVIGQITAWPSPGAPILATGSIALLGRNFLPPSGGITQVIVSGLTLTPATLTASRITVALPPGLAAGTQTAQVIQPAMLGTPPVAHPGTGLISSIAAFVLVPAIAPGGAPGTYAVSYSADAGSPPGPAISMTLIPTVQVGQRVLLQLTSQGSPPESLLFDGGTLTAASNTILVPTPALASGTYAVQVLVDGAESSLVPGATVTV
jgi:hypothetical protein